MKTTQPSYACCDRSNPHCRIKLEFNKFIFDYWSTIAAGIADEEDFPTVAREIAFCRAESEDFVKNQLFGAGTFAQLPLSLAVFNELNHLSINHMITIATILYALPKERWGEADELLASFIVPTREDQLLPSPAYLGRRLRRALGVEKVAQEESEMEATFDTKHGGVVVDTTPAEAAEVERAVKSAAQAAGTSQRQALLDLIRQKAEAKYVLNFFSVDGKTPIYLEGAGDLNPFEQEFYASKINQWRTLDGAEKIINSCHDPSDLVRLVVSLRDGHCAFPDCEVEAGKCEKHHVIKFENGGPTTAGNLLCLCRKHHNMVTFGKAMVFMDHGGRTKWVFPSGLTLTGEPDGPLAPSRYGKWVCPKDTWGEKKAARKYQLAPGKQPNPVWWTPPNPDEVERF